MFLSRLKLLVVTYAKELRVRFVHWTKPLTSSLPLGTLADLARSGQPLCTITPHRSGLATRFPVTDLFFRPLCAFFIIEHKSRKVIHVGVTRSPTDLWVTQQLREATPYGQAPKYLIRDNDSKFGFCFARVATTSAIEILKRPIMRNAPMRSANASPGVCGKNASTTC